MYIFDRLRIGGLSCEAMNKKIKNKMKTVFDSENGSSI